MRVYRPTLTDPKYRGLSQDEKQRQWERDKLLYDNVIATEKLAKIEEEKYNKQLEKEYNDSKEEYDNSISDCIQSEKDYILGTFLKNASNIEITNYFNRKEKEAKIKLNLEQKSEQEKVQDIQIEYASKEAFNIVHDTYEYYRNAIDMNRIIKNIEYLQSKNDSNTYNIFITWFCIMVFGGVLLGVLSAYTNIEVFLNIFISFLIIYPISTKIIKMFRNHKINKLTKHSNFSFPQLYSYSNYIKKNDFNISKETLNDYKKYCIDEIMRLYRYCKNSNINSVKLNVIKNNIIKINNIKIKELDEIVNEMGL